MSRHSGPGGPGSPDSQANSEAEAAAIVTAIAGLRWRLRRQDMLEHPAVLREMSKLENQVAAQLARQADRHPGRHRSPAGATPGRQAGPQIGDAFGYDLKPDPASATTAAQFIRALWEYKVWSGDPSWRKMAARAGQTVVHSTMHAAMHGDTLPKLDVVRAVITGCGGGEDDLRTFATAWRRIQSAHALDTPTGRGFLPAPVPAFQLVPATE
jgi:hypothetical protein